MLKRLQWTPACHQTCKVCSFESKIINKIPSKTETMRLTPHTDCEGISTEPSVVPVNITAKLLAVVVSTDNLLWLHLQSRVAKVTVVDVKVDGVSCSPEPPEVA